MAGQPYQSTSDWTREIIMTLLIARKTILRWPAERQVDQHDPWFGGQVVDPGTTFSEPNVSEVARLIGAGAARFR